MNEEAVDKPEKLRLLHLVLDLDPGGTQRLVIEMCKYLRARAEIRVCCLDRCGEWAPELLELGVPVTALERRGGFRPSLALRVAALAKEHQAQVLHCHHYSPFVYGSLAARLCSDLRVVYTEHGRLTDRGPSRKRRLANVLFSRLPSEVFAVSRDLSEFMASEGFPRRRIGVIYNGIEVGPPPTPTEKAAARESLALPVDSLVIGTVARLDPVKNLGVLIDGFAALQCNRPASILAVIGDGPERANLELAAKKKGVWESLRFIGWRKDVRALLPAFDIYANTSVTEGISVTILEAMAAALPVVATRVGGTPEIVRDGETGVLVRARDAASTGEALRELAADSEWRARLGRAARQRVSSHFSLAGMTDSYLQAYGGVRS